MWVICWDVGLDAMVLSWSFHHGTFESSAFACLCSMLASRILSAEETCSFLLFFG